MIEKNNTPTNIVRENNAKPEIPQGTTNTIKNSRKRLVIVTSIAGDSGIDPSKITPFPTSFLSNEK